jgi:hypothetical protein
MQLIEGRIRVGFENIAEDLSSGNSAGDQMNGHFNNTFQGSLFGEVPSIACCFLRRRFRVLVLLLFRDGRFSKGSMAV